MSKLAQITHKANQASQLHYIVTDHAGTPQELCSEKGDVVWQGEQALWGHYQQQNTLPNHGFRENAHNDELYCDLRYQGQIEDRESGLYYNVNRYYDADSGQYLSPDPIGFAGGLRPQAYVFNPLDWVDPLGLSRYPGVDFTNSPDLFSIKGGQQNIVKVKMQGARGRDFTQAFKESGITRKDAEGYTWHHVDDFNPETGSTTMQLVKREAHEATFPHGGSVSQYEKEFGVTYDTREAIVVSEEKGWLKGKPPKCK